jgi:hypothetical protein
MPIFPAQKVVMGVKIANFSPNFIVEDVLKIFDLYT